MKISLGVIVAASFIVVAATGIFQQSTKAVGETLSDTQIAAIKTHCTQIQGTLNQLQQSDTLLRYNVGASYRTLSEKLMVPLNQRIAATDFDGSALVRVTASYNKEYQEFYQAYQSYSNSLQEATKIDCSTEPEDFYNAIMTARQKRIELHETSTKLVDLLKEYKKEFSTFRKDEVGVDA